MTDQTALQKEFFRTLNNNEVKFTLQEDNSGKNIIYVHIDFGFMTFSGFRIMSSNYKTGYPNNLNLVFPSVSNKRNTRLKTVFFHDPEIRDLLEKKALEQCLGKNTSAQQFKGKNEDYPF